MRTTTGLSGGILELFNAAVQPGVQTKLDALYEILENGDGDARPDTLRQAAERKFEICLTTDEAQEIVATYDDERKRGVVGKITSAHGGLFGGLS